MDLVEAVESQAASIRLRSMRRRRSPLEGADHQFLGTLVPVLAEARAAHADDGDLVANPRGHAEISLDELHRNRLTPRRMSESCHSGSPPEKPDAWKAFREPGGRDLRLQAGERGAQAEMNAVAEGEVGIGFAADVEPLGFLEGLGIANWPHS